MFLNCSHLALKSIIGDIWKLYKASLFCFFLRRFVGGNVNTGLKKVKHHIGCFNTGVSILMWDLWDSTGHNKDMERENCYSHPTIWIVILLQFWWGFYPSVIKCDLCDPIQLTPLIVESPSRHLQPCYYIQLPNLWRA